MKKSTAILTTAVLATTLTATGVALAHGTDDHGSTSPGTGQMTKQGTVPQNKPAAPGRMMRDGAGHGTMMGGSSSRYQGQPTDANRFVDDLRNQVDPKSGAMRGMGR